jgi:hypothetical protein
MPIKLAQYIEAQGFRADPFETSSAESEADWLPALFVPTDVFPHLANPHSAILFAPPGHGKTSHRMEVERIARSQLHPYLVVTFIDFDLLLERGVDQLTIQDYIEVLRRAFLLELHEQLTAAEELEQEFRQHQAEYAEYQELFAQFTPQPSRTQRATRARPSRVGTRAALEQLARIAQAAQFRGVYFLLDGLDEWADSANDPEVVMKLLRPLLGSTALLFTPNVTFKFFLPQSSAELIGSQFRLDKIRHYSLSWNDDQLLHFLANRLTIYSQVSDTGQRGRVERFQTLCSAELPDIDRRLVEAAQQSPRRLIELGRQIFEQHCLHAEDPHQPIQPHTVQAVLNTHSTQEAAKPESSNGRELLFIDQDGTIFIGENRLKQPSKLLRRCLFYLWEQQPRLVPHDELVNYVYSHLSDQERSQRADLNDSLHRLMGRLRKLLEPDSSTSGNFSSSPNYIYGSRTLGYQLVHVRRKNS